jgi:hypothetical protein
MTCRYRVLGNQPRHQDCFQLWSVGCCFLTHAAGQPRNPPISLVCSWQLMSLLIGREKACLLGHRPVHTYTRRNHSKGPTNENFLVGSNEMGHNSVR